MLKVDLEFVQKLQSKGFDAAEKAALVSEHGVPERPWHAEKLNKFLGNLSTQIQQDQ